MLLLSISVLITVLLLQLVLLNSWAAAQDSDSVPAPKSDDKGKDSGASKTKQEEPTATEDTKDSGSGSDDGNNDGNSDSSSDDGDDGDDDDEDGQPGMIQMVVPPSDVPSPQFEINSNVTLQWKFSSDTKHKPGNLIITCFFPDGMMNPDNTPIKWNITTRATGNKYVWDTVSQTPPGRNLQIASGYKLFIWDPEVGLNKVRAGYAREAVLKFTMYKSAYDDTNNGIPKGYNPSSAPSVSVNLPLMAALTALGAIAALLF
ncbi:hypothetical protein H4219_002775 [Mycoemilia scoparia]|uniref:DUF7137 domain-containing protein n=1 Tax=Mycoemilia scoparia TaxID=417184 RepID=A0A9W8A2C6_9FUNG|nr:hypothetical protein H4219_002775 [Mycoemilia scoparia]